MHRDPNLQRFHGRLAFENALSITVVLKKFSAGMNTSKVVIPMELVVQLLHMLIQ